MEGDIYKSPQAVLEVVADGNYRGSPLKAITIATLIDIVGSLFSSVVIAIVYSVMLASRGMPEDEVASKLQHISFLSPVSLIGLSIGCMITVYAGYFCAKKVNYSEYKFVSIYCLISVLFGLILGSSYNSPGEIISLSVLTIISAFFGAWLFVSKKNKQRG